MDVSQQDQPAIAGEGPDQFRHEREIHLGCLVHHHDLERKTISRMVAERGGVGEGTQKPVQGGDLQGQGLLDGFRTRKRLPGRKKGLPQAGGGLAGGGGEGDPSASRHALFQEEGQNLHHGGGLSRARTAGNDAKSLGEGREGGHLLPVRFSGWERRKKTLQVFFQETSIRERSILIDPPQDGLGQILFIGPVAVEVESGGIQDERGEISRPSHDGKTFQFFQPTG